MSHWNRPTHPNSLGKSLGCSHPDNPGAGRGATIPAAKRKIEQKWIWDKKNRPQAKGLSGKNTGKGIFGSITSSRTHAKGGGKSSITLILGYLGSSQTFRPIPRQAPCPNSWIWGYVGAFQAPKPNPRRGGKSSMSLILGIFGIIPSSQTHPKWEDECRDDPLSPDSWEFRKFRSFQAKKKKSGKKNSRGGEGAAAPMGIPNGKWRPREEGGLYLTCPVWASRDSRKKKNPSGWDLEGRKQVEEGSVFPKIHRKIPPHHQKPANQRRR